MAFTFNPLQKKMIQEIFAQATRTDIDTVKYFVHGGKGAGKSLAMLWTIVQLCLRTPTMTGLIVRRTYKGLTTDTINILKRQPGILKGLPCKWKGDDELIFDNGSILYFRHLENNDELTFGPSMGLIYIEQVEMVNKDDYLMLKQRLRQFHENSEYHTQFKKHVDAHVLLPAKNYLLLNANPRGGWVHTDLVINNSDGFTQISLPTWCNQHNLRKDYVDLNSTEAFRKRNYDGIWEDLKGLIYPEFSSKNMVDSLFKDKLDISKLNNYIIADPGYVISKWAVLFACVLPNNDIFIYDELSFNGKDSEERNYIPHIAAKIKEKIKRYNIPNYIGIIDPASKIERSGPSDYQQLIEQGLHFKNAKKTGELASFSKINSLFMQSRLKVSMDCLGFLKEIEAYSYKVNNLGEIDHKEEPEDKNNDFMDCMKYLINDLPFAATEPRVVTVGHKPNAEDSDIMRDWTKHLFTEDQIKSSNPTHHPYRKGLTYGLPI